MTLRPAVHADATEISRIYNHYVRHSTATYQEHVETVADREAWLRDHGRDHPVLVAEIAGEIAGWASLSPFHTRSAFRHTVESSVYIDARFHRRGIGRCLMAELISLGCLAGHHVMIAAISGEQSASLRLHETLGFIQVGRLREVGRKFDRWLDLITMEKRLS